MKVSTSLLNWDVAFYLQQEVRGVVYQHHQRANPDEVGTVGEGDEEYCGDVMDHLLLEVLNTHRDHTVR